MALLCSLSLASNATQFTNDEHPSDINAMEEEAWRLACVYMAAPCRAIEKPQIWYEDGPEGAYGVYMHGYPGIYVNLKYYGTTFSGLIMLHEMVHYIQHMWYGGKPRCQAESEAFNIVAAMAKEYGLTDARVKTWLTARFGPAYQCYDIG